MSLAELRKVLKTEKLTYGSMQAIRNLKKGKVKRIFLSSDCSDSIREDIKYYSRFNNVEVTELKQPSDELRLICKKGFQVTCVSH